MGTAAAAAGEATQQEKPEPRKRPRIRWADEDGKGSLEKGPFALNLEAQVTADWVAPAALAGCNPCRAEQIWEVPAGVAAPAEIPASPVGAEGLALLRAYAGLA